MEELVSIIVPIYNGERYISRAVDMLCKQTYTNIEIILINDGSTDLSDSLCKNYQESYNNVVYIYQENQGPGAARNRGMREAKGNYIAFVDCDDYVYPEYIELLYSLINKYDTDIAVCSYKKVNFINENNDPIVSRGTQSESRLLQSEEALCSLFYRKEIMGYPYCKLFRKEVIENIRFFEDTRIAEDFYFIYQVLKRSRSIAYVDKELYLYVQNYSSITHTLQYEEMQYVWKMISGEMFLEMKKISPLITRAIRAKLLILALDYLIRMKRMEIDLTFKTDLCRYIKCNCKTVLMDRYCKKSNRLLALGCCVNINAVVLVCYIILKYMEKVKLQLRKAV